MNYRPLIPYYQAQWMLAGKRGSGPAAPFDPTAIAGLKLWLRASSLALADGTPVSTWTDSSSNGNNATQSGTARPVFKTNIINGLPVIRFASANLQFFNLTAPITDANYTVIAVMQAAAPPATGKNLPSILSSTANSGSLGPFLAASGNVFTGSSDGTLMGLASGARDSAFHVFTGMSNKGPLYIDGASNAMALVVSWTVNNMDLIGRNDADGDIAEIVVYNSVLATTDRQNVELYLKTKYATP